VEVRIVKWKSSPPLDICMIPIGLFRDLGLSMDHLYTVHLGQAKTQCFIRPDLSQEDSVYMSEAVFDKIMPLDNIKLNIWVRDKNLYLGPVVGIFETPAVVERIAGGGGWLYELQHMLASRLENCICYYFSPEGIDWDAKKIRGITYLPELDKWEYLWFPMPQVMYDEGIFLSKTLRPVGRQVRKQFRKDLEVRFINSRNSLDKWELCDRLSSYPEMAQYIPETVICTDFSEVFSMLTKHKLLFIKSLYGSRGEEVVSIEDVEEGYRLNYYDYYDGQLKEVTVGEESEVVRFIEDFMDDNDFIIQQGIKSMEYEGRKVDLRILLIKDEEGRWQSIYNVGRIAKGKATITNHSAGGDVAVYEEIYPRLSSSYLHGKAPDREQLDSIGIIIAGCIEKEFGDFGELGLDVIIDNCGHVWIMEANAKSYKIIETESLDINGNCFMNQITKYWLRKNNKPVDGINYSEVIVPQAQFTFKYARFLAKKR
jgi:hypothetical protein